MIHDKVSRIKTNEIGSGAKAPVMTSPRPLCQVSGSVQAMRPTSSLNARDQINAAIDRWAESLVSIIEASDNPQASLLRAHLAIAIKHKELETMAWRELETRGQRSGVAHE
jgi:hypothetical protein